MEKRINRKEEGENRGVKVKAKKEERKNGGRKKNTLGKESSTISASHVDV